MLFKIILLASCLIAIVIADNAAVNSNNVRAAGIKNIEKKNINPIKTLETDRLRRSCKHDKSNCDCSRRSSSDSSSESSSDSSSSEKNHLRVNGIVHKKIFHQGVINLRTNELRRRPSPRLAAIRKHVDINVKQKRVPTGQRRPSCGCGKPNCGCRN